MKNQKTLKISSYDATMAKKPKYNGHICATGVHGDIKYNRRKNKRDMQIEINGE